MECKNGKGHKYFNGCTWAQITRDERWFCHILSKELEEGDKVARFMATLQSEHVFSNWINDHSHRESKIYVDENSISWPTPNDQSWEVGFEVAFYRDLIFHYGHNLEKILKDAYREELHKLQSERFDDEKYAGRDGDKKISDSIKRSLSKRTFDLCLFGDNHVVVIEAKADGKFDVEQGNSIKIDRRLMQECFKFLSQDNKASQIPALVMFGLVSSKYPHNTNCYKFDDVFEGVFSWKFLASLNELFSSEDSIAAFLQADATRHLKSLGLK